MNVAKFSRTNFEEHLRAAASVPTSIVHGRYFSEFMVGF